MDDVKVKKVLSILWKIAIILIFEILLLSVAQFHEHWGDEAHSFLLARDNSFAEILKYTRYEGTPPLWFFILKIFLLLGGTYSTYYLLPILFSVIGVCILEFKVKAPWYIKVLLPFTYYIAYQYSIVARSYCLVFPLLMLVACLDQKKMEKPIIYAITLFPLMMISLHTLCIAGSLFLIWIIEIVRNKQIKNKKYRIACGIIFVELVLTVLMALPTADCYYVGSGGKDCAWIIAEATFSSNFKLYLLVFGFVVCSLAIILYRKEKIKILEFFILFLPILTLLESINCQPWHIGIIFLLIVYYLLVSDLLNNHTFTKILFVGMCLIQISWTAFSYHYDLYNNYSASKDVANYIKQNHLEDKKIYGIQFNVTAIQPYFDQNIFMNQKPSNKAFWSWSKKDSCISVSNAEMLEADADIYIVSSFYAQDYKSLMKELEQMNYTGKIFNGFTFFKTERLEAEGYILYMKPEILDEIEKNNIS